MRPIIHHLIVVIFVVQPGEDFFSILSSVIPYRQFMGGLAAYSPKCPFNT